MSVNGVYQPVITREILDHPEAQARIRDLADWFANRAIEQSGACDPNDCEPEYPNGYALDIKEAMEQAVWLIPHEEYPEWKRLNQAAVARRRGVGT